MGDSVPKHTGPISLTDTHLEPSVSRTRPTTTRENPFESRLDDEGRRAEMRSR
jgi:hypothetical protein